MMPRNHDSIRVIMDGLTESTHYLLVREDHSFEKYARVCTRDNPITWGSTHVSDYYTMSRSDIQCKVLEQF